MQTILDDIVAHKLTEIADRKSLVLLSQLEQSVQVSANRAFEAALQQATSDQNEKLLKLILEIKPSSPSGGVLTQTLNLPSLLENYTRYASALSVLTDQKFFNGSLELLSDVVGQCKTPVLCKDFFLDPYQVYEARQAGADAVLLIVKILSDAQLQTLHRLVRDLGMTAVVEVQNEQELERAFKVDPTVLLINNRNLETFAISLETTLRLAPLVPQSTLCISASGIGNRQDIETLLPVCNRFLIGSVLMKTPLAELPVKLEELCGR